MKTVAPPQKNIVKQVAGKIDDMVVASERADAQFKSKGEKKPKATKTTDKKSPTAQTTPGAETTPNKLAAAKKTTEAKVAASPTSVTNPKDTDLDSSKLKSPETSKQEAGIADTGVSSAPSAPTQKPTPAGKADPPQKPTTSPAAGEAVLPQTSTMPAAAGDTGLPQKTDTPAAAGDAAPVAPTLETGTHASVVPNTAAAGTTAIEPAANQKSTAATPTTSEPVVDGAVVKPAPAEPVTGPAPATGLQADTAAEEGLPATNDPDPTASIPESKDSEPTTPTVQPESTIPGTKSVLEPAKPEAVSTNSQKLAAGSETDATDGRPAVDCCGKVTSTFEWNATRPERGVQVTGSFNGWKVHVDMESSSDGVWKTKIPLEVGEHSYKFLVDGQWMYDIAMPTTVDDHNNVNNLLVVSK